jgi:hypothetical protein
MKYGMVMVLTYLGPRPGFISRVVHGEICGGSNSTRTGFSSSVLVSECAVCPSEAAVPQRFINDSPVDDRHGSFTPSRE